MTAHGGLFRTPGAPQRLLAAALRVPVALEETAGEGGPYGMALLAAYRLYRRAGETLAAYLNRCVFADARSVTLAPDADDVDGFAKFLTEYKNALNAERAVVS